MINKTNSPVLGENAAFFVLQVVVNAGERNRQTQPLGVSVGLRVPRSLWPMKGIHFVRKCFHNLNILGHLTVLVRKHYNRTTGIPRFIMLCFIELHRCWDFFKN